MTIKGGDAFGSGSSSVVAALCESIGTPDMFELARYKSGENVRMGQGAE